MTTRGRGRPRRAGADEEILEAARAIIREHGYRAFSVDEITARTGVAKTTIYRRWPSKASLAAAAFEDARAAAVSRARDASPGAIVKNLEEMLASELGAIAAAVIAEAQSDPSLLATARAFTEPHRALLMKTLSAAAADERIAPLWLRLLVPVSGARG